MVCGCLECISISQYEVDIMKKMSISENESPSVHVRPDMTFTYFPANKRLCKYSDRMICV